MAGPEQKVPNVNFSKYISVVFEVGQKVMWHSFDWLYHHHHEPGLYVGECLRRTRLGWKRIGKKEEELLNRQEDPKNMDIPLLYRCLQHTCGLKEECQNFAWNMAPSDPNDVCLEHSLYQIKEARNAICHEMDKFLHMSTEEFDSHVARLAVTLSQALREAGRRSSKKETEIDSFLTELSESIKKIRSSTPSSSILPHEFALLAKKEIAAQWMMSSSKDHLSAPLLEWAANGREAPLGQLLLGDDEKNPPQVLILLGETGIGKSSLCWQLVEAWLNNNPEVPDVAGMDLVIHVECRRVFTRDLTRLLREDLLPKTCERCSLEEMGRLLSKLRVMWLVDGFEEVTADARQLLSRLMERRADGHVVLLTGQQNYLDEVNSVVSDTDVRVCHLTHRGLTKDGMQTLLASHLNEPIQVSAKGVHGGEKCMAFMRALPGTLGPDMMKELRNPLKLILAVRLWEEGRLTETTDTPLKGLYGAIQDALIDKLVVKLRSKNNMVECEARERVQEWFEALSKEALSMWVRGCFVSLDKEAEKQLKKSAMLLMLPSYTDCFSTFLCYRSKPHPHYTFLHHTQQSIMAAQHLQTLLMQGHTKEHMMAILLNGQPSEATMDRFLDMLVMVATNLEGEGNLDDGRAEVIVGLMGECSGCLWLDVLRITKCSQAMAKQIHKRIKGQWNVEDDTVEAAGTLLQFAQPQAIYYDLSDETRNSPHLISQLQQLSKIKIDIRLKFFHSFLIFDFPGAPQYSVDDVVLCLCGPTTSCKLLDLQAFITLKGCPVLSHHIQHLQELVLDITDVAMLDQVIGLSYEAHNLKSLSLHFPSVLPSFPARPVCDKVPVSISVATVDYKDAERTVQMIRRINHSFQHITFSHVKPATLCRMLTAFKQYKVRTLSLGRWFSLNLLGKIFEVRHVHIFPLPLPHDINKRTVYKMWDKPSISAKYPNLDKPITLEKCTIVDEPSDEDW